MRIQRFKIDNCFSFPPSGTTSIELSDCNLIIGKNDSGKTNIIKSLLVINNFLYRWSREGSQTFLEPITLSELKVGPDTIKGEGCELIFHNKETAQPILFELDYLLSEDENKELHRLPYGRPPNPEAPKFIQISGKLTYPNPGHAITFEITGIEVWDFNEGRASPVSDFQLDVMKNNSQRSDYQEVGTFLKKLIAQVKNTIYLKGVRDIQNALLEDTLNSPGGVLLKKLRDLKEGNEKEFKQFKKFQDFILNLTDDGYKGKNRRIVFPTSHDSKIDVGISNDKNVLPLSHYGSGVGQLFVLAANIVLIKPQSLVLIEEPEVHFHPELQRNFLNYIFNELQGDLNHQYIILSHSPIFIDKVLKEGGRIYLSKKNDPTQNATQLVNLEASELYGALDELGVQGSDILQSNGVIWVEGPSDRIYINKWLNLYSDLDKNGPKYGEGEHYSIFFYGGSLLSWLSVGVDSKNNADTKKDIDNFIRIIKLNRKVAVIVDRDKPKGKKWETKERIQKEIEENAEARGDASSGYFHATVGKEIENYLPEDLIKRVYKRKLKGISPRPKYTINSKKPFSHFFKSTKTSSKCEQSFYEQNKVIFAQDICDAMTKDDLRSNEKLESFMKELSDTIKQWND